MTEPSDLERFQTAFYALAATRKGAGAIVRSCCNTCAMDEIPLQVRHAATWAVLVQFDGTMNPANYDDAGNMVAGHDFVTWGGDGAAIVRALRAAGLHVQGEAVPGGAIVVDNPRLPDRWMTFAPKPTLTIVERPNP